MRVAIVHYWLVERRGGERVVEALCDLFPDADIFTNVYDPRPYTKTLAGHRVLTTFINSLPFARRLREQYLALMPLALEQLDLRGYDLVISSESGPAKGVIVPPEALHICYCHSPMRYAWDLYPAYLRAAGFVKRAAMRPLLHYLRFWDQASAARPDHIIANSNHTKNRIARYWKRDAEVIPPPVDTARFVTAARKTPYGDYYLCAGELVSYKRVDLAIEAFNDLQLPLVVAGGGADLARLRRRARSNITFLGWRPDEELATTIAHCRALVFPGEEDFGIVPVEAMAAGRPVIAYGRGGVLDTVVEGTTGLFFHEQTPGAIAEAVLKYERERASFDPQRITAHAERFNRAAFIDRFARVVRRLIDRSPPERSTISA
jgi:glycosyltransferase involved in cell wall biosynthesis